MEESHEAAAAGDPSTIRGNAAAAFDGSAASAACPPSGARTESPWRALGQDLLRMLRDELASHAEQRKQQGAARVEGAARFFTETRDRLHAELPSAAVCSEEMAARLSGFARYLRARSYAELHDDANALARRHAGACLLAGAVIGFCGARFLKSEADRR